VLFIYPIIHCFITCGISVNVYVANEFYYIVLNFRFLYGDQACFFFFEHEIRPELKHSKMGTVSMVSAGENLNASQVV
jgi:cyclophilin family peptidyl-prolyl cis-trans isomerase